MKTQQSYKRLGLALTAMLVLSLFGQAITTTQATAAGTDNLALPNWMLGPAATISPDLTQASGAVQVVIQLKEAPLALTPNQPRSAQLKAAQDNLLANLAKYGAKEVARLNYVLNAVVVELDARQIKAVASEYNVKSIDKVVDYEVADSATLAQVGATTAQAAGYTGKGRIVAVLDSGIDYTHTAFGGPGTPGAYTECYGAANQTNYNLLPPNCRALFGPGAPKVIDGTDFVGSVWPNGPLTPDANPIDCGLALCPDPGYPHGTHVSDTIAGLKNGVAPGASIVAVKVCSSVNRACSGAAILQGLDYVIQYNVSHPQAKIDVINLSLGSPYGQQQSSQIVATQNAVATGIVVVTSTGNSGNKTYITGTPGTAPGVISVAATANPTEKFGIVKINSPTSIAGGIPSQLQTAFSPIPASDLTGPVQYGDGAGNVLGCTPFAAGSATGKIVLIDRGSCNGSEKAANAAAGGPLAVLIANNIAGPPPNFGKTTGSNWVPTYSITLDDGNKIKVNLTQGVSITVGTISAVGSVASYSSRGPSISDNIIKPEIAAPGNAFSANAGTGSGEEWATGTSFAAPMVAGAALIVRQKYPSWEPIKVKGLLMNTASTEVKVLSAAGNFYAAPISLVGAGELRVNRAANSQILVTAPNDQGAALSFGYLTVPNTTKSLTKTIRIYNLTDQGRLYTITGSFRDPADEANGAVTFQSGFPRNEWVAANSYRDITILLQVNGQKLRPWNLDAGSGGSDATTINELEYDGYLTISAGTPESTASVPWHVFPHKAADVQLRNTFDTWNNGSVKGVQFSNSLGVVAGQVDTFQLLGTNGIAGPQPGAGADNVLIDLKAFGVRELAGNLLQFAVSTYEKQATPNAPAVFFVYLDLNNDGEPDYVVYNAEFGTNPFDGSGRGGDGRNVVYVGKCQNAACTSLSAAPSGYFTDTTYNTGNLILTLPSSALNGGKPLPAGTKIAARVEAFDNYFQGVVTDRLPGAGTVISWGTYTVGAPRFTLSALPWAPFGSGEDGNTFLVTVNGKQLQVNSSGTSAQSNASGLLFMYRDAQNPDREVEWLTLP